MRGRRRRSCSTVRTRLALSLPLIHNDVRLALEIHAAIRPIRTVFTHVGHEADLWRQTTAEALPAGVEFGYDGMMIEA